MAESSLDVIKSVYVAFERRDMPAVFESFDPDIRWIHPDGMRDLGVGGTKHGHEGVRAFLAKVPSVLAGQRLEPEEFVVDGDRVVVFGKRHVTAHNGNTGVVGFVHSWTLTDGMVVSLEDTFDTHALRSLLGH
jgi:ketosteroid isomerase-like protein